MITRMTLCRAVAISIVAIGGFCSMPVLAQSASQGAFHAATGNDIPFIQTNGYALYNSDTTGDRAVTASLGYYSTNVNRNYLFHVYAFDNGGSQFPLACFVAGVTTSGSSSVLVHGSTTTAGSTGIDFTVPVTAGNWFLNLYCQIPPTTAAGQTYLYAWTQQFLL